MFKEKLQVFFLGLMLGLLVGVGFFILKMDSYFKELNFYKNLTQKTVSEGVDSSIVINDAKTSMNKQNSGLKNKKIVQEVTNSVKDTLTNTTQPPSVSKTDSVAPDSLTAISNVVPETIIVRKDQLLGVKLVEVLDLGGSEKNNKDSLVGKVSGIREDNAPPSYSVEYWQSPLNYKGYKMTKSKVVLYGINQAEGLKLYRLENGLYLKYMSSVYRLEYSPDFRQLEKMSDENLIARLK